MTAKFLVAASALLFSAAGAFATQPTIKPDCDSAIFQSVNYLDRPSEGFVEQIRQAIGRKATRAEAYLLGEAYCRHPKLATDQQIAAKALIDDIKILRKR